MYGFLYRRTGARETAEDLAQETFYRATRAFLGWKGGSPEAWLLTIAHNVLVDHGRRHRVPVPLEEPLLGTTASPEAAVVVEDLLSRLSVRERRLLELVHIDGFSHAEVAALSGSTTSAVKSAVWRARRALEGLVKEGDRDRPG